VRSSGIFIVVYRVISAIAFAEVITNTPPPEVPAYIVRVFCGSIVKVFTRSVVSPALTALQLAPSSVLFKTPCEVVPT
jgi:hypothetical protein